MKKYCIFLQAKFLSFHMVLERLEREPPSLHGISVSFYVVLMASRWKWCAYGLVIKFMAWICYIFCSARLLVLVNGSSEVYAAVQGVSIPIIVLHCGRFPWYLLKLVSLDSWSLGTGQEG